MQLKKTIYIVLLLAGIIAACSTNKNTGLSRGYHNLTAHYNVYFNGNESYKKGVQKVREKTVNDYSELLPIFEYSNKKNAQAVSSDMDRAIEKSIKLIQKHSITKKPKKRGSDGSEVYKKFYNQKEFNKWVDNAYLLIGKAQFYKHEFDQSIMTFDLVQRDFSGTETFYESKLWKAAAYSEKGDYANAKVTLESYDEGGTAPIVLYGKYMAVYADLLLKQELYRDAIPYIKKAAENAPDKWTATRFYYVLAQTCEKNGNHKDAVDAYAKVVRKRPPYEMAFNAKLGQVATVFDGADIEEMKREIKRMIRNRKNEKFRDRLYYSLALVHMDDNDEEGSIENLKLSTEYSVENDKQKALSFITLGDIYFERPEYRKAYEAYDSAIVFIPQEDKQYELISEKYNSLKELVSNIEIVEREDSLQLIASMGEVERMAFLQKIIVEENKRLEEEARKKQEELMGGMFDVPQVGYTPTNSRNEGKWYFYNYNSINTGKSEFQRRWGRRSLEDNWRRKDKSVKSMEDISDAFANEEEGTEFGEEGEIVKEDESSSLGLTIETLLADVPLTDSAIDVSNKNIQIALLEEGIIYRDNLSDFGKAEAVFEELLRRFPDSERREDAYIELYQVHYFNGNETGMLDVKQRITSEYPDSKFTAYLNDPEFFDKQEQKRINQEKLYEETYSNYLNGLYMSVIQKSDSVLNYLSEDEDLAPKYRLVKSLAYARMGKADEFKLYLSDLVDRHNGTEQADLAELMLAELANGRVPVKSNPHESQLFKTKSQYTISSVSAEDIPSALNYEPDKQHSLLVLINAEADMKRLVYNMADYNFGRFLLNDYDLLTYQLPDGSNVLEVKGFNNKREALDYFYSIRQNPRLFKVKDADIPKLFNLSDNNLKYLLSSGDISGCILFFIENYLKVTPQESSEEGEVSTYALSYVQPVVEEIKDEDESNNETSQEVNKNGYGSNKAPFYVVASYKASRVNHNRLKSIVMGFNRNNRINPMPQVDIADLNVTYKMLVVKDFDAEEGAENYLKKLDSSPFTLRDIKKKDYQIFIIGEDNYKQMVEDQSIDPYLELINKQ